MLRFLFWSLLLLNGFLLAFNLGYLGHWSLDTHEPERLKKQHHADQLKLITASEAATPTEPGHDKKPEVIACLEVGNFLQTDLPRIEDKLKTLALGDRQSRINVVDVATHMVFIPSQGSKEGADKKAGELRRLGITDFYVIQDQSSMRFGISLGVFKTEEAAKLHLNNLNNKGVRSARVGPRTVSTNKFAYQLRTLSSDEKAKYDAIKAEFPAQENRNCQATAYSRS
ncbi:SPOR domain-containing protein [Undibacterium sp. TS12]|uniref:SPOR domain-containing protein n=1 Tax=Undibacterium sp. TS12 TaxID=2908202 RepID=UPI001F4CAE1D|nr:SPOR domain-containing protein [Undibacterium sp. TS12]MCH8617787.1 SPOR domain-containing protein [Undibacterium sp. TS12]